MSLMTPNIEQQLASVGVARVIVTMNGSLAPVGAAALGGGRTATGSHPEEIASSLAAHLVESDNTHDRFVAKFLARKTLLQRRGRLTAATAALESTAALTDLVPNVAPPPKMRVYSNLGLMLGSADRKGILALWADRRVHRVTGVPPIQVIRPVRVEAAQLTPQETWGLQRLRIPEIWQAGFKGTGVVVGHLDTGVDGSHPALRGAIADFAEFDLMGNRVPGAQPHDSNQHGTHTAGTIVGRPVQSSAFGVAPEAKLASALVIEGGDVVARILGGLDWIAGMPGVHVLSMSLGLPGYHEDFLPVVQALRARGILPVFAVGNEGPGTSRSPGNYIEALSVGACNQEDQVADFSSSQRFERTDNPLVPDVVAPGVGVISCVPGGQFASMDGTSMATPHIAGLAALLFQAKTTATVDEVEQAIFNSCTLLPGMAPERGNRGIPDGVKALQLLLGQAAPAGGRSAPKLPRTTRRKAAPARKGTRATKAQSHGTRKGRSRTAATARQRRSGR